jgi:Asp/Glu/Hydantoin racemase
MRIALIHAMAASIPPIMAAFARLWPEARLMNLMDDSLAADLARDGRLTEAMTARFLALARYARSTGADAILFTCSAFGPCIEACARDLAPIPVLKPNEAMIEEALALTGPRGRIGLLATFAPTLASMPPEFAAAAPEATLLPCLAEAALAALNAGDAAGHDAEAARTAATLADCDVIALAQFSLSRAAAAVAEATGKTVLTTPDSAIRKLRRLLLPPHLLLLQGDQTMDLDGFRTSIQDPAPHQSLSHPLQALWWDAKGDWARAHECAQAERGSMSAAVHAYLHRKEPDLANARYWYNAAGRAPFTGSLEQEWNALAEQLLTP